LPGLKPAELIRTTMQLDLLSRSYCHLCDLMLEAVRAHPGGAQADIRIVDVDADPALEARFDEQVPVLMHGDEVICWGRFDAAAFAAFVARQQA
jgi:hypothetical protein